MKRSLNDFSVFINTIELSIITKLIIKLLYIVEIDKLTSTQQQEWRTKEYHNNTSNQETQTNEKVPRI